MAADDGGAAKGLGGCSCPCWNARKVPDFMYRGVLAATSHLRGRKIEGYEWRVAAAVESVVLNYPGKIVTKAQSHGCHWMRCPMPSTHWPSWRFT